MFNDFALATSESQERDEPRETVMDPNDKYIYLLHKDCPSDYREDQCLQHEDNLAHSKCRFGVDQAMQARLRFGSGNIGGSDVLLDTSGPRESHWEFIPQHQFGFSGLGEALVKKNENGRKSFDCDEECLGHPCQVDNQSFIGPQDDAAKIIDACEGKNENIVGARSTSIRPSDCQDEANAWTNSRTHVSMEPINHHSYISKENEDFRNSISRMERNSITHEDVDSVSPYKEECLASKASLNEAHRGLLSLDNQAESNSWVNDRRQICVGHKTLSVKEDIAFVETNVLSLDDLTKHRDEDSETICAEQCLITKVVLNGARKTHLHPHNNQALPDSWVDDGRQVFVEHETPKTHNVHFIKEVDFVESNSSLAGNSRNREDEGSQSHYTDVHLATKLNLNGDRSSSITFLNKEEDKLTSPSNGVWTERETKTYRTTKSSILNDSVNCSNKENSPSQLQIDNIGRLQADPDVKEPLASEGNHGAQDWNKQKQIKSNEAVSPIIGAADLSFGDQSKKSAVVLEKDSYPDEPGKAIARIKCFGETDSDHKRQISWNCCADSVPNVVENLIFLADHVEAEESNYRQQISPQTCADGPSIAGPSSKNSINELVEKPISFNGSQMDPTDQDLLETNSNDQDHAEEDLKVGGIKRKTHEFPNNQLDVNDAGMNQNSVLNELPSVGSKEVKDHDGKHVYVSGLKLKDRKYKADESSDYVVDDYDKDLIHHSVPIVEGKCNVDVSTKQIENHCKIQKQHTPGVDCTVDYEKVSNDGGCKEETRVLSQVQTKKTLDECGKIQDVSFALPAIAVSDSIAELDSVTNISLSMMEAGIQREIEVKCQAALKCNQTGQIGFKGSPTEISSVKEGIEFVAEVSTPRVPHDGVSIASKLLSSNGLQPCSFPVSGHGDESSISPPMKPFNEQQQAQLRAQILVYGSLIQGAVPQEAQMVAAFANTSGAAPGEKYSEGCEQLWEKVWQESVERAYSKASFSSSSISHKSNAASVIPSPKSSKKASLSCTGTSNSKNKRRETKPIAETNKLEKNIESRAHKRQRIESASPILIRASHSNNSDLNICSSMLDANSSASITPLYQSQKLEATVEKSIVAFQGRSTCGTIADDGCNGGMIKKKENLVCELNLAQKNAEQASLLAGFAARDCESMWIELMSQNVADLSKDAELQVVSSLIAMKVYASIAKVAAAAAKAADEAASYANVMRENALRFTKQVNEEQTLPMVSDIDHKENMVNTFVVPPTFEAVSRSVELTTDAISKIGPVLAMGESPPFTLKTLMEGGIEGFEKLLSAPISKQMQESTTGVLTVNPSSTTHDSFSSKALSHSETNSHLQNVELDTRILFDDKEIAITSQMDVATTSWTEVATTSLPISSAEVAVASPSEVAAASPAEVAAASPAEVAAASPAEVAVASLAEVAAASPAEVAAAIPAEIAAAIPAEIAAAIPAEIAAAIPSKSAAASPAEVVTTSQEDFDISSQHGTATTNPIALNSLVEVLSDEEGLRGVWFSAKVLRLECDQVLVLYDELLLDNGRERLQEWIPLKTLPGKVPRVRLAHPSLHFSQIGTKRTRKAIERQQWAVGDRVDALIRDGWWEGEITEIFEDDENKVKVFFPGGGDSQLVKVSNLRPSMLWCNEQWILWSREGDMNEHEMPNSKRLKLEEIEEIQSIGVDTKTQITTQSSPQHRRGKDLKLPHKVKEDKPRQQCSNAISGISKSSKQRKLIEVPKHDITRGSGESTNRKLQNIKEKAHRKAESCATTKSNVAQSVKVKPFPVSSKASSLREILTREQSNKSVNVTTTRVKSSLYSSQFKQVQSTLHTGGMHNVSVEGIKKRTPSASVQKNNAECLRVGKQCGSSVVGKRRQLFSGRDPLRSLNEKKGNTQHLAKEAGEASMHPINLGVKVEEGPYQLNEPSHHLVKKSMMERTMTDNGQSDHPPFNLQQQNLEHMVDMEMRPSISDKISKQGQQQIEESGKSMLEKEEPEPRELRRTCRIITPTSKLLEAIETASIIKSSTLHDKASKTNSND